MRAGANVLRQRLDERLERHGQTLITPAVENGRSTVEGPPGHLGGQACLTDSRLSRHQHQLELTVRRNLQVLQHRIDLTLAATEGKVPFRDQPGWSRHPVFNACSGTYRRDNRRGRNREGPDLQVRILL